MTTASTFGVLLPTHHNRNTPRDVPGGGDSKSPSREYYWQTLLQHTAYLYLKRSRRTIHRSAVHLSASASSPQSPHPDLIKGTHQRGQVTGSQPGTPRAGSLTTHRTHSVPEVTSPLGRLISCSAVPSASSSLLSQCSCSRRAGSCPQEDTGRSSIYIASHLLP